MLKTLQKIAIAGFGFVLGAITAPFFVILWPFAAAFILWHEYDSEEDAQDVF